MNTDTITRTAGTLTSADYGKRFEFGAGGYDNSVGYIRDVQHVIGSVVVEYRISKNSYIIELFAAAVPIWELEDDEKSQQQTEDEAHAAENQAEMEDEAVRAVEDGPLPDRIIEALKAEIADQGFGRLALSFSLDTDSKQLFPQYRSMVTLHVDHRVYAGNRYLQSVAGRYQRGFFAESDEAIDPLLLAAIWVNLSALAFDAGLVLSTPDVDGYLIQFEVRTAAPRQALDADADF